MKKHKKDAISISMISIGMVMPPKEPPSLHQEDPINGDYAKETSPFELGWLPEMSVDESRKVRKNSVVEPSTSKMDVESVPTVSKKRTGSVAVSID